MDNLKEKRLLVLGGTNNAPDIDNFVKAHGITLVVAGLYFSQEILEIADESYIIDILDRKQLEEIVLSKNIDGIFVGGNEDIISCTIDVCEKLGLPFYSSRTVWDNAMNKRVFKQTCRENGVPTMEDYDIDESDLDSSAKKLKYPVVETLFGYCLQQPHILLIF